MLDASTLIGRKILVLTAHPDDESFLASGTLYKNSVSGGQAFLICATLGEKGSSHLKEHLSEKELKNVRHKELHDACGKMNIHDIHELNFPDGAVDQNEQELYEKISELIPNFSVDLIMSFGTDGITGHKDHIGVSRVAVRVAAEHHLPLATFCLPPHLIEDAYEWLLKRRKTVGHYAEDFKLQECNVVVPIDSSIKLKCLKCYESQIEDSDPFAGFPKYIADSLLEQECFYYRENKKRH